MPRLSLGLGVQNPRKIKSGGAAPSGLAYANTSAVAASAINFTLFKENTFGDSNLLYCFDNGSNTPTKYYTYTNYDFIEGTGVRALLAFNANASTYYSNQPGNTPDVSLSTNKWYLIKFLSGDYDPDAGGFPSVPGTVYVNNSIGQSGNYIPTSNWSTTITIQNGAYAANGVNFNFDFNGASDQLPKYSNTNWSNSIDGSAFSLTWNNVVANQWALNCDGAGTPPAARATSTNGANSAIVPLDGWSYTIGSGQAITLSPFYL